MHAPVMIGDTCIRNITDNNIDTAKPVAAAIKINIPSLILFQRS